MANIFEGSYLGDASKIADDTKLECGICWHVYDPAEGDDYWQVAAGTPFSKLPDHWRCPVCDAEKEKFMVISDAPPAPVDVAGESHGCTPETCACGKGGQRAEGFGAEDEALVGAMVAAYLKAEAAMRTLPVHNKALRVEAVGFRRVGTDLVGIMVTPWCMNIVVAARGDIDTLGAGVTRSRQFPSGEYEFVGGRLDGVGAVELCSLFSPMDEFDAHDVAHVVAQSAIDGLFVAEEKPEAPKAPVPSRRNILFGNAASAPPAQPGAPA
jgi:[NiFe] hydrogenase assembly HybE family chaperone